jgi:hypothetical protein
MSSDDEPSSGPRIEQLRAEAAATRSRLADDVDALEHKLSPANLRDEAKLALERGARRWTSRALNLTRQHPALAVLAGLSAGWLLWAIIKPRPRTALW